MHFVNLVKHFMFARANLRLLALSIQPVMEWAIDNFIALAIIVSSSLLIKSLCWVFQMFSFALDCTACQEPHSILDNNIGKKYFHPGRMAPSEWTRSIRVARDTTVAEYSTPSINSMRRVQCRPQIDVSLFLLILFVSYFKQSLSHCGQL
jgi:hypothetical protein